MMSDCSTNAFKVPECEPKTCGNCGRFMRDTETKNMGICAACYFEDGNGNDMYKAVWNSNPCMFPHEYAERTDTLEQRHQQLQQVAREMFKELTTEWLSIDDIREFRNRLTELGVDVDD